MRRFACWELPPVDAEGVKSLQEGTGLERAAAEMLWRRGLRSVAQARRFLEAGLESLSDPFALPGVEAAVQRLLRARQQRERVLICGDYDVDGVCSVVLAREALGAAGIESEFYIPSRMSEGYGLSVEAVRLARTLGCRLMLSVDCGIAAHREAEAARAAGVDLVITDHHQLPHQLPQAAAVVNPRLAPGSPSENLCGAGVVFQVVRALGQTVSTGLDEDRLLELVALATVADVVPLQGDNRILVREGLLRLRATRRAGLQALLEETGLEGRPLTSWHIGFVLGPRLNAAGRVGHASSAVDLLSCPDLQEARVLARFLGQENRRRQEIEASLLEEARAQGARAVSEGAGVLVVAGEGWHQGVLGIVAARLVDEFKRPAVVISWDGEEGRGSGRSLEGFDLYRALQACSHLLVKFGGHRLAAGLTVRRDDFDALCAALNHQAQGLPSSPPSSTVVADAEVTPAELGPGLLQAVELMAPFGEGNPEPILIVRRAQISKPLLVGRNGEHLKFWVEDENGRRTSSIGFRMADLAALDHATGMYDLLGSLERDDYHGKAQPVLRLHDIKPSRVPDAPVVRGKPLAQEPAFFLTLEERVREDLRAGRTPVLVYPSLRCLERHWLSVSHTFPSRALAVLHGRQLPDARQRIARELAEGGGRLLLTTSAFFPYYRENLPQPRRLGTVHVLWPEEGSWAEEVQGTGLRVACYPAVPEGRIAWRRLEDLQRLSGALIYANRSRTVRRLAGLWGHPGLEAGVTDLGERHRIRLGFLRGTCEVLISDARFGASLPVLSNARAIAFADSPYGWAEVYAFLSQVPAPHEAEVYLAFSTADMDFNRRYLEKVFPGEEALEALVRALAWRGGSWQAVDAALQGRLEAARGCRVEREEVTALLYCLAEAGRAELRGDGTRWEVRLRGGTREVSWADGSPYFREGEAQKRSLERWCAMCVVE